MSIAEGEQVGMGLDWLWRASNSVKCDLDSFRLFLHPLRSCSHAQELQMSNDGVAEVQQRYKSKGWSEMPRAAVRATKEQVPRL